jgi:O-antigen/teichoic acid export membrane protein
MTAFVRQTVFLFLALRLGDAVSLAAGMWLVPKYVSTAELGAVLPVTSFATCLAIPAFAFAFVFMREAAVLAAAGAFGRLKSLIRGVFLGTAAFLALALAAAALLLPRLLAHLRVPDAAAGFLVIAAAFLGCIAPVYTDALNALKRFRALGAVEVLAAAARFLTLLAVMPLRAFAGYFAGSAVQPLVRIAGAVLLLRRETAVPAEPYWSPAVVQRLGALFCGVAVYQMLPMFANFVEQAILRTHVPDSVSAGYYLATRLSDLIHTVTFPLLMVLFPTAAETAAGGGSTRPVVLRCAAVTLLAAVLLALVYAVFGDELLARLPNGHTAAAFAPYLPWLVAITALTACQTFCTNAEIAAGRFGFLLWFVPLHALFPAALTLAGRLRPLSLETFLAWLTAAALLRFAGAAATVQRTRHAPASVI